MTNAVTLIAVCVLCLFVGGLGFGLGSKALNTKRTTSSSLLMANAPGGLESFATQLNALTNINTEPQFLGIQDLLQQSLLNHELAVSFNVAIMAGIGYMLLRQLSQGKEGIHEYWFTIILLGDLAYSINQG